MTLEEFKRKAKKIPDGPGVYFFLAKNKKVLYIGKATSLKSRVRSYFAPDLATTRGPLLVSMLDKANSVEWRETDSVLEALILEANLVRTHKPKHNTDLKDDKSFNYVVITKEDFPRVLLVRGKELESQSSSTKGFAPLYIFGPFPHGLQLKEALRIVRKIFPYRDTCTPCAVARLNLDTKDCKPCFNRSLSLCPGVCSGEITQTEYRKNIRRIVLFFQGKKKELLNNLEKEMRVLAKKEKFEAAAAIRGQVFALTHIQDVSLIKDEYRKPPGTQSVRIEAYDAAHLGGSAAVGVMVVVDEGLAQKKEYRKFILRSTKAGDDVGALREILSRRLGHNEWPLPRLIVVDGSKAQLQAAAGVLEKYGVGIPLVGVVKDDKHRPRGITGDQALIMGREKEILLANAEAHRYAIAFHRRRRSAESGLR